MRRRSTKVRLATCALGAAVLSLVLAAGAQAKVEDLSFEFPIEGNNPCNGEPMSGEGRIHLKLHIVQDSSGGVHFSIRGNQQGSSASAK